jgi:hypothetical protein
VQQALQLSPQQQISGRPSVLGDAELALGHFDDAVEEYPKVTFPLDLAVAYALRSERTR